MARFRRAATGDGSLLVRNRVDEHTDALNVDLAAVAALHEYWRLAREANARGRAGDDDIAGLERHALADVDERLSDREHHVVGVVRLHGLAVEPRLNLQALAAGRQLVGGQHRRAEAAGVVEVLEHVSMGGLVIGSAATALVGAGIVSDAGSRFWCGG